MHRQPKGTIRLPAPIEIQNRVPSLDLLSETLPQKELRSWFNHLNKAKDLTEHDFCISYKVGPKTESFLIKRKRILFPDGSEKIVSDANPAETAQSNKEEIKLYLISRLKNRSQHLLDLGKSQGQFISELVDNQFNLMDRQGVEVGGYFTKGLDNKIRHVSTGEIKEIVVDLGRYYPTTKGRYPVMGSGVSTRTPAGEIMCRYHLHPLEGETYPEQHDLFHSLGRGHESVIIASPSKRGGYVVSEWQSRGQGNQETIKILKKWVRGRGVDGFGWLNKSDIRGFDERFLCKTQYSLTREGTGIGFKKI
ncbi:MAG: hypothetical protein GF334_03935 [Candidatus Altiarchaeales archaeon]|nr:hypothetical protein [Candidatus Altiarchaeales archaeon]